MSKESNSSSGIGFMGLLFLVFLVLKLCHVIDWSWWYVTMPLWGGTVLFIVVALIGLLGVAAVTSIKNTAPPKPTKSKWQERAEQMKASQEKLKNK